MEEEEKPQIDLNEFLQQLGILKEEDEKLEIELEGEKGNDNNKNNDNDNDDRGCCLGSSEVSNNCDYSDEVEVLSDKSFNWDSIMEIHPNIEDNHFGNFQLYDHHFLNYEDDLSLPNSIWDFEEDHSTRIIH